MNTKQKLTLGIAAIFMVTLTIVGVTYAYFVTRVTTNNAAEVDIKTTRIGEVYYEPGNGTNDVITLNNIFPGDVTYKTFSVTNDGDASSSPSSYSVYYEATTFANAPQFAHSTDNAGTGCYNVAGVKRSTEEGYTASCFAGTAYDNIYYTVYSVNATDYATINKATTAGQLNGVDLATAGTVVKAETRVKAATGVTASTVSEDISTNVQIGGQEHQYYVVKVEYKNNDMNQNIDNEARLDIKVNIR